MTNLKVMYAWTEVWYLSSDTINIVISTANLVCKSASQIYRIQYSFQRHSHWITLNDGLEFHGGGILEVITNVVQFTL